MSATPTEELRERLQQHGQGHLLQWWDELDSAQREALAEQIETIDFDLLQLVRGTSMLRAVVLEEERIEPPAHVVRLPQTSEDRDVWWAAEKAGTRALADGKVGAILVAGGQGTRLGFEAPKGMYPIGPVSGATLFQILTEQLLARSRRAGKVIPYYVMTSDPTHDATIDFFREHDYFGMKSDDLKFFRQGKMPAVDKQTGRVLLSDKHAVALSPDGHGGMLEAIARSGCLADMQQRGIEYLYYHQVDNPTAIVCDPTFIGFHIMHDSELTTKIVAKRGASEKMGVVVESAGKTRIVEYINMPHSLAEQTDATGGLVYWAGNTAIHVFNRSFFDRLTRENIRLPLHPSEKKVAFLDEAGRLVSPDETNAYKFERFIFDALPRARQTLVVEADRAREFNPVKNAEGSDTPATAQAAMSTVYRRWLNTAGAKLADGTQIEISPLFALDEADVKQKVEPGRRFDGPVVLK